MPIVFPLAADCTMSAFSSQVLVRGRCAKLAWQKRMLSGFGPEVLAVRS
jgi:hypothetical protein